MLNFKLSELIKSKIAQKENINNMPDVEELDNLMDLMCYCLQPVRELINKPMIITSGYRNEKLNAIVKGAKNSQHLKGQAADFKIDNMKPDEIIAKIKNSNIIYDQLINEKNQWVHISYNKNKNRKEILKIN